MTAVQRYGDEFIIPRIACQYVRTIRGVMEIVPPPLNFL
jgi:hypothetical protein